MAPRVCGVCAPWSHSLTPPRVASYQLVIILIAAALEGENYQEALEGFEKVVALENSDKGEWCASVHRQMSAAQLYDPKCTHNC